MFATNCWLIANEARGECIIVDPGASDMSSISSGGISDEINLIVSEEGFKPVAALLTHGHLDHTFSIKALADGYEIPTYIHSEDRRFIAEPAGILSPEFASHLGSMQFDEPERVQALRDGASLEFIGLNVRAIHAPGHTKGSLMFMINEELLISGDVLFAGSIGRTDLPSGSASEMRKTLMTKILPLSDDIRVLPGHGQETTIKLERKNNPYLKELSQGRAS
jgi:glyoxylase-like metal-dependent hydrolase (beta-lactamase superfamily II)